MTEGANAAPLDPRVRLMRSAASVALARAVDGALVLDAEGKIVGANAAFTEILGYPLAELSGRLPEIFKSGLHGAPFYAELRAALDADGRWRGEVWSRRRAGEVFPLALQIEVVSGPEGEALGYLALVRDVTAARAQERRLAHLLSRDPLTGLANRRGLLERLGALLARRAAADPPPAVLAIDLERFKSVNEVLGHGAGDAVLVTMAERLEGRFGVDAPIARTGSDEFVVVLEQPVDSAFVAGVAEDVLTLARRPFRFADGEVQLGATMGVAMAAGSDHDAASVSGECLLRHAMAALDRAHRLTPGSICFYDPGLTAAARTRLQLRTELRRALDRDLLTLAYQPIVGLPAGDLRGVEALARWRLEDGTAVSPAAFIPVAEESGMIVQLGEWLIRTACAQLRRWDDAGVPIRYVAVNVSVVQLRQPGLAALVRRALDAAGLGPERLLIEVTEGAFGEGTREGVSELSTLREAGVRVAIDDFGTGYSSLGRLRQLPVDVLKIDKAFLASCDVDEGARAVMRTVATLGRSLGMQVVAEGIETYSQRGVAASEGCHLAQGYLFAPPLPPEELVALWQRSRDRGGVRA